MKWEKKGLLYSPDGSFGWNKLYGILPTPYLTESGNLRIFFASTDADRIGRVSFIDVSADDPSKVIYFERQPILDAGIPGDFDDCGCNPSCAITVNKKIYLFYAGYQRSYRIPYSIFSGLAISNDQGRTFQKYRRTPILDRTEEELTIRSAPSVLYHNGKYLMWYVSATGWEKMEDGIFAGRMMPRYVVRSAESDDAIAWKSNPLPAIECEHNDEFGFGRPWVIRDRGIFKMWYSVRRKNVSYRIGYAESENGVTWKRKDDEVGIDVSESGWDSEMVCYPAVIQVRGRTFLFYNGNNNGGSGFGWAELDK